MTQVRPPNGAMLCHAWSGATDRVIGYIFNNSRWSLGFPDRPILSGNLNKVGNISRANQQTIAICVARTDPPVTETARLAGREGGRSERELTRTPTTNNKPKHAEQTRDAVVLSSCLMNWRRLAERVRVRD